MNFCSRFLRLSIVPRCRERPQIAMCFLEESVFCQSLYSATIIHSQSGMIKITFCSLSSRSTLISLILVSFWFILPYSVVIPPRSGILQYHSCLFRLIPVSFGFIPESFRLVPAYFGSFRYIPLYFCVIPPHSGVIPPRSGIFRCHSGSFRHIPVYSGIFCSIPFRSRV